MKAMILEMYNYYDVKMTKLTSDKYGYTNMDAFREFLKSKTRQLLENPRLEMWKLIHRGFSTYEKMKN